MPKISSLIACLALTFGAIASAVPALAQQPAAPPVITMPAAPPVITTPAADLAPLVIPPPPGGKLRVEMDARSEDLLGMMKSFLKGIGETGAPRDLGSPAGTVTPGQRTAAPNPIADAIASGDLAAMLKDVNHVHFVVYEVAGGASSLTPAMTLKSVTLNGKPQSLPPIPAAPPAVVAPAFDSNSFYETAFASEGAHRLLYTDADAYKLVMVGFPDRHGFALAASGGGYVFVERSDGYPDLEVLTAFISHVTTAVANSQMGKKMMNSAVDSSKLSGLGVK